MTVAERIKRKTPPLSFERDAETLINSVKYQWVNYGNIWVSKGIFIDGSTLECRVYLCDVYE